MSDKKTCYLIRGFEVVQVDITIEEYEKLKINNNLSSKEKVFDDISEAKLDLFKKLNNNIDFLNDYILEMKNKLRESKKKKRILEKEFSKKEVQISFY